MSPKLDDATWGNPAEEYAALDALTVRRLTHLRYSERADELDDDVTRALTLHPGLRVLDVGSGTGAYLRMLRELDTTLQLVGLDQSEDAGTSVADLTDVDFVLGDARALPFSDATSDRVVARHMLYHLANPTEALREMRRVVDENNGTVVAVVNHNRYLPRIIDLIVRSAEAEGVSQPEGGFELSAHSENLEQLMADAFERAELIRSDNALVFDDPAPLIAYSIGIGTTA